MTRLQARVRGASPSGTWLHLNLLLRCPAEHSVPRSWSCRKTALPQRSAADRPTDAPAGARPTEDLSDLQRFSPSLQAGRVRRHQQADPQRPGRYATPDRRSVSSEISGSSRCRAAPPCSSISGRSGARPFKCGDCAPALMSSGSSTRATSAGRPRRSSPPTSRRACGPRFSLTAAPDYGQSAGEVATSSGSATLRGRPDPSISRLVRVDRPAGAPVA